MGGAEIRSKEGTIQGDPVSMCLYAIGILPLLSTITNGKEATQVKHVAYADDITGTGTITALKSWWDNVIEYGKFIW